MSEARARYVQARESLLARITETLKRDQRFVAAWLAGSYGRGEQEWSSDLDLHVVVANDYSECLCAQPWSGGAKTTEERLTLFKQFGEPAVIYDAHANNTIGGTFTYVLYRESAINVDWMLIPQSVAHREYPSLLLFNHGEIPEPPPEELLTREQRIEQASLHVSFFFQLCCVQEEQVAVLRALCDEMEALMPDVVDLGGYVPSSPRSVIEMRLLLLS